MKSWVAVVIMWIGFAIGGVAMVAGPTWWLFWVGAAIVAIGGIFAVSIGIWKDVVLDDPRVTPEAPHRSESFQPGQTASRAGTGEHTTAGEHATVGDPQTQSHG
jgi:hypothetical protein